MDFHSRKLVFVTALNPSKRLILGAVAMLLPFVWMISTSLKPADQLFTVPPTWIPQPLQFDTYAKAMSAGNFGRYAFNSLLLACL